MRNSINWPHNFIQFSISIKFIKYFQPNVLHLICINVNEWAIKLFRLIGILCRSKKQHNIQDKWVTWMMNMCILNYQSVLFRIHTQRNGELGVGCWSPGSVKEHYLPILQQLLSNSPFLLCHNLCVYACWKFCFYVCVL